jgi:hypothetical protein
MTAMAMIIGMIPMALGLRVGGRAVIGGLIFATVATLFFVRTVFMRSKEGSILPRMNLPHSRPLGQKQKVKRARIERAMKKIFLIGHRGLNYVADRLGYCNIHEIFPLHRRRRPLLF